MTEAERASRYRARMLAEHPDLYRKRKRDNQRNYIKRRNAKESLEQREARLAANRARDRKRDKARRAARILGKSTREVKELWGAT